VESHLKKLAREERVRETLERDAPSQWLLLRPPRSRWGAGSGGTSEVRRAQAFEASGLSGRVRRAFTECLGPCAPGAAG
jgi:hypothetical protein